MKVRTHNEWFQSTVAPRCDCGSNRKSRTANHQDTQVWIWGEYVVARWRTVQKVCQACWSTTVIPRLRRHAEPCGCTFALQARSGHGPLPTWMVLPADFHTCQQKVA
jgi:hypothetical protein